VLVDREAPWTELPDSRPSSPLSGTTSTADTVTVGFENESNDRLSLSKLERHFELWQRHVARREPWDGISQYPSIFGYVYQPPFHGRLKAIASLKDTIVRVTGSGWAIPADGRINLSFTLSYLLSPVERGSMCNTELGIALGEIREDELRYAALQVEKLGHFDRELHGSKNRGFFVADFDPRNALELSEDGSFVIYKFGARPSEETGEWDPDKNKISWEKQKIEIKNEYVINLFFASFIRTLTFLSQQSLFQTPEPFPQRHDISAYGVNGNGQLQIQLS
jgi:hypothetical protein